MPFSDPMKTGYWHSLTIWGHDLTINGQIWSPGSELNIDTYIQQLADTINNGPGGWEMSVTKSNQMDQHYPPMQ